MKVKIPKQAALRKAALFSMAALAIFGGAQTAGAFATAGSTGDGELCAFSTQLQQSVSVRRDYLVKIDRVLNAVYTASNTVEDMYGNIVPAAYSDEDNYATDADTGGLSLIFGSVSKQTSKGVVNLDSFTVDCLSCHDGIAASNVRVDVRDRPYDRTSRVNSFKSEHPLGMSYDLYVAANRGYKNVGTSTKMIFANGKVGCLTCHDPLNPEKGHLVMSDRESALCRTCHDK